MISQEKTIKTIEGFDKGVLRHAETAEKNPLPNKESKIIYISIYRSILDL